MKRITVWALSFFLSLQAVPVFATDSLDSDAFLKMLLTQLAYQDPTEPMSNAEMVSQLADLTMMEQSAELTQAMHGLRQQMYDSQGLYASGLVGKSVMVAANLFEVEDGRQPEGEVLLSYSTSDLRIEVYPGDVEPGDDDPLATLSLGEQKEDGQIPFSLRNLKEPLKDGSYRMYSYARVDDKDTDMTIVQRGEVKSVVFPGNGQDVLVDVRWIGLVPIYAITEFQGDYIAEDDDDEPSKEPLSDLGRDLARLVSTSEGEQNFDAMKRKRRNGEIWTTNPLFELKKSLVNSRRQPMTRRQAMFRTL